MKMPEAVTSGIFAKNKIFSGERFFSATLGCARRVVSAKFEKNDAKTKTRYEKILAVSSLDSVTHFNLGYLYLEDPYYHARAAKHFRSYLESQPDDENRAVIEETLASLEH